MISVHALMLSKPFDDAIEFGFPDRPVYVRFPDGSLHEIQDVENGQIMTSAGGHDVIVLVASELTSREASAPRVDMGG